MPGRPLLGVGVASYLADPRRVASLRCLVESWRAQTYDHWRMLITHDGPLPEGVSVPFDDPRVSFSCSPIRLSKFGHPHRQGAIDSLKADCQWLVLTNDDNYYAPVFAQWLLSTAVAGRARMAYCNCVHSHKMWKPLVTEARRGKLDLGGLIVESRLAASVPFSDFSFSGDGTWIDGLVAKVSGKVVKVPASLFVHN